jgi:hypothetical protein
LDFSREFEKNVEPTDDVNLHYKFTDTRAWAMLPAAEKVVMECGMCCGLEEEAGSDDEWWWTTLEST